jgi:type IV pilus assembly protein PilW
MKPLARASSNNAGFSLIELLVSMVIGLVVTLAITSVLIRTEGSKRSTTSVNDINQTGAFSTYVLDRAIRSAGSGFSQSWPTSFGCQVDVRQGTTQILPIPAAISASSAFAGVTTTTLATRLAPVIIGKGLADAGVQVRGDVLMVMAGTAGAAETGTPSAPNAGTASIALSNTLNYRSTGGDMVLLADPSNPAACMVEQVSSTTASSLSLGGTYYTGTSVGSATGMSLGTLGATTVIMQLGKDVDNPPQFQLFGVGDNSTLVSMDLLKPIAGVPDVSLADGVVEMRALYGIANGPTYTTLDSWVDPATVGWTADVLTNGSATSRVKLRQIVAIRLGLILRTSLQERPQDWQLPTGTTLTLFSDLGTTLQQTRALSSTNGDLNYRYRTVEVTIPLRNVLMAPQS